MELRRISLDQSPIDPSKIRLEGEVVYDRPDYDPEIYWFDFPEEYKNDISLNGNPWLVLLTPLAMLLKEPLRICAPVDAVLIKNISSVMKIWKCWYSLLEIISIDAETMQPDPKAVKKTAVFFSGGVDSFFSVLRHDSNESFENKHRIDDLLCVRGFDIPLANADEFSYMKDRLKGAAGELNKNFIDIATNIKDIQWKETDWGYLSHGAALATVALCLENRYSHVLVASTGGYGDLQPWGSHPMIDYLFSTANLQVIHDGAEFNRLQKTDFISKSAVASKALHVCHIHGSGKNCSSCAKCYRTMMMLDLFGVLDKFSTFERRKYDLKKASRLFLQNSWDFIYAGESLKYARSIGRQDIASAVEKSFRHTAWLKNIHYLEWEAKILKFCCSLDRWLSGKYFIWRFRGKLKTYIKSMIFC